MRRYAGAAVWGKAVRGGRPRSSFAADTLTLAGPNYVYSGGRLALFHLDLYRLETPGQIIAAEPVRLSDPAAHRANGNGHSTNGSGVDAPSDGPTPECDSPGRTANAEAGVRPTRCNLNPDPICSRRISA